MQSKVPLYPYSAKDAMKRGEIEKWRESFRENCACAGGIDILIRENFDGMHLKKGTVEKIVELCGYMGQQTSTYMFFRFFRLLFAHKNASLLMA